MCGSVNLYDPISRELAIATEAMVICIDYRLAPEHPYPCGLEDCQYLLENYQSISKIIFIVINSILQGIAPVVPFVPV